MKSNFIDLCTDLVHTIISIFTRKEYFSSKYPYPFTKDDVFHRGGYCYGDVVGHHPSSSSKNYCFCRRHGTVVAKRMWWGGYELSTCTECQSWKIKNEDDRYQRHKFELGILFGMKDTSSTISILNQDPETTLYLKRFIADYVGISFGEKLHEKRLRDNMTRMLKEYDGRWSYDPPPIVYKRRSHERAELRKNRWKINQISSLFTKK